MARNEIAKQHNAEKDHREIIQEAKAPTHTELSINMEAKHIANSLRITDRIDALPQKSSFITLKDHKDNFANKPTCRLIHLSKCELTRQSKQINPRKNQQSCSRKKQGYNNGRII